MRVGTHYPCSRAVSTGRKHGLRFTLYPWTRGVFTGRIHRYAQVSFTTRERVVWTGGRGHSTSVDGLCWNSIVVQCFLPWTRASFSTAVLNDRVHGRPKRQSIHGPCRRGPSTRVQCILTRIGEDLFDKVCMPQYSLDYLLSPVHSLDDGFISRLNSPRGNFRVWAKTIGTLKLFE